MPAIEPHRRARGQARRIDRASRKPRLRRSQIKKIIVKLFHKARDPKKRFAVNPLTGIA
jgi:hypothetical protein